jgi:hypothetical protein
MFTKGHFYKGNQWCGVLYWERHFRQGVFIEWGDLDNLSTEYV